MSRAIDRRTFVKTGAAFGVAAAAAPRDALATATRRGPEILTRQTVPPVVISDRSGIAYTNGGPEAAVERAFRRITEGADVLDALIEGVNIPELDPEETGIGYGGLPNADGVVQLDSCCMHGPERRAGGVAALEGVRTPSRVARAVMDYTDHHLLVGGGAQAFARNMGFEIEDDLNTPRSRELWLEWRRRVDPGHWLDPDGAERRRVGARDGRAGEAAGRQDATGRAAATRRRHGPGRPGAGSAIDPEHAYRAALSMLEDGLIPEHSFWGTINCDGVTPAGDLAGVTTTSGLSWKIPGRVGDSPILGAGLYVDNDVGAAGSTGRGEANLYNLSTFLIVEQMRQGMHPTDAGMAALRRIRDNTVERRLLNSRGLPNFNVRFFVLNKRGEFAGVSMYASSATESVFAVATENGAEERPLEPLLDGSPTD